MFILSSVNFITIFVQVPLPPRLSTCPVYIKTWRIIPLSLVRMYSSVPYLYILSLLYCLKTSHPLHRATDSFCETSFPRKYTLSIVLLNGSYRGLSVIAFPGFGFIVKWRHHRMKKLLQQYVKDAPFLKACQFSYDLGGKAFGLYPCDTKNPEIFSFLLR